MDDHEIFTIRATHCKRCGGLLTNPEAIKNGYGHICMGRVKGALEQNKPDDNQVTIFDMIGDQPTTNNEED